jgi:hypothetical protein
VGDYQPFARHVHSGMKLILLSSHCWLIWAFCHLQLSHLLISDMNLLTLHPSLQEAANSLLSLHWICPIGWYQLANELKARTWILLDNPIAEEWWSLKRGLINLLLPTRPLTQASYWSTLPYRSLLASIPQFATGVLLDIQRYCISGMLAYFSS